MKTALFPLALALTPVLSAFAGSEEEVIGLPPDVVYDPAEVTARLIELGQNKNEVTTHLRVITKDIGPRMTSSQGLIEAQGWARDTFRRWGLESWLEEWGEFPVGFDRGPSSGRMVAPEEMDLMFMTQAWTPGTAGPVRGRAILEPMTAEAVDAIASELAGAWLFRRDGEERPEREVRQYLDDKCKEMGTAGVVRRGPDSGLLVTGGNHRIEWDDLPTSVSVRLLDEHYDEILERLEANEVVELEFDIQNYFRKGPIKQHNVVADIKGREKPDEYVIIQAHIDSWDGAEGAADNGTGTSITLEAARLLMEAGVQPRRTIRFVLYSGEEQGLFGSKGYVESHKDEHHKISVVFNHDNGTQAVAGVGVTPPMVEDFENCFRDVMELETPYEFAISEVDGLRPGPSDHAPFVRAGIPAFFWKQSEEGYRRIHHTQYDTYEETDPEALRYSALVVALAAHNFAELDHMVDRTDMRAPQPRLMGVRLDRSGVGILELTGSDTLAAKAGWQAGDMILSVDGEEMENSRQLVNAIRSGGPKKVIVIKRGDEEIESTLDWSDDPDEPRRAKAAAAREARREARRAQREAEREARRKQGEESPEGETEEQL